MRRETFSTPGQVTLIVRVPSGMIDLETDFEESGETIVELEASSEIEEQARIESRERRDGHEVLVQTREEGLRGLFKRNGDVRLRVTVPPGAEVEVSTASADVKGRGPFGRVSVDTASGDVRFEHVGGEGKVNSASGDVSLSRVEGDLKVNTASGEVDVDWLGGEGTVRAASGDITVGEAEKSLKIQTASGDQEVRSVQQGDITLQSASGDIDVGIKRGSKVFIDAKSMSGETRSDLEVGESIPDSDGPLVEIHATAMSGDITVRRA